MKIVCPYCENVNEVEKGALTVSCEKCGQSFSIEDGKTKTMNKYKELQNVAYSSLYHSQDYQTALDCYEELLNIRPNDLSAINGIAVARISMSTFSSLHFKDVIDEIEKHDIVLNIENSNLYLHFVKDILNYIEIYYEEVKSRLVINDVFINSQFFEEYVNQNKEILEVIQYFEDSFPLVDETELECFKNDFPTFEERIVEIKKFAQSALNSTYKVNHFGDVKVEDGEIFYLHENKIDMEVEEVTDLNLMVENKKGKKLTKIFFPVCGALALLTLIFFIVFGVNKNPIFLYISIVTLVLAIGLFVTYRILLKRTFRK